MIDPVVKGATLPAKVTQDFFVVGGPVQPDRPCYIRRPADRELLEAIGAAQFSYVLGPRAMGKSSLMGRTIRRLRADGEIAAVVDLAQIGTRADSLDSARWQYSIAYRICRELRLKVDLQAWWQERTLLSNEQRLVEFFWDIVLANTDVSVTVFFDEAERLIDRPFAGELFAALNSAYLRRVSEPEYSRLNFVVLGVASAEQLCPDVDSSPFATGRAIGLDDFTVEECLGLAPGFDGPEDIVHGLLERIHGWTHGQPYLTQKLARGVARKGGALADLDPALHELFLAPRVAAAESYLGQMRAMLADGTARGRQATAMLTRLAKGRELIFDPSSPAQQLLHLGGFVSSDENGMLRFRNRIIEEAFDVDWARTAPPRQWQRPAAAAGVAALAVAMIAYWYTQVLPRPYIETLTLVASDYQLAQQAHERLGRLPGFGRQADELLTDVMVRRSSEAETLVEARAADEALRSLPDRSELADRLMAAFWLRRSEAAAHLGDRDPALVYALAALEAGSDEARSRAANLIDGDYALLDQSIHFDAALTAFEVDWARQQIVAVDADHRLHRIALADAGPGSAAVGATGARASTLRLTALEHVGVTRGFFVDEPGRAGALQLRLTVDHPRTSDLLVQLRAPSGAAADLPLPRRDGGLEDFIITGSPENALASLADESVTGQWELTVFDRLGGESGSLISWGLSFPGVPQFWDDSPVEGVPLPDPERTEQISVALASDGRKAATIPVRADARGAASVWDLAAGELIQDLPLTGRASFVRFLAEDRLLLAGPAGAALWHIGESDPIAEFGSATGFALPPAVSSDGRFFGVAEAIQDGVRIELYSHTAGRRLARFETDAFQDWALAQEAAAVVVTDASRRGRVIDPMTGETQTEFFHDQELRRILAAADHVVAVDVLGEVQVWSMTSGRRTLTPADAVSLGSAVSSAGVEVSRDGTLSGVVSANGTIRISRLSDGYRLAVFDQGPAAVIGTRIDSEGRRVVSADAGKIRSWQLPSAGASGHDFGDLSAVAIAPSGEFAVLGHRSGQVRLIRDLPAAVGLGPESTADYFGHRGVITSLAINQSGEMAGSGGSDGLVRVWDTQTGAPGRYIMRHPAGPINALAFSSNGRWIASAGPRSARVFDLETGSLVNEIEVEGAARALAFSPAGNVMAVGDAAGNLYILAPDGTQGVRAIRGRSPINVLRFTGTPEVLASGSDDGNLVFWNTLDGQAVQGALRFSAPIRWVDFSADESEAHVQSGSWLYQLTRNEAEFAVTAARLLPAYLRAEPALTQHEGPSIRALAVAGGGRLALADIPLTAAPPRTASGNEARAAEADTLTVIEARNWRRAMGLEIDPAGGSVRTILP